MNKLFLALAITFFFGIIPHQAAAVSCDVGSYVCTCITDTDMDTSSTAEDVTQCEADCVTFLEDSSTTEIGTVDWTLSCSMGGVSGFVVGSDTYTGSSTTFPSTSSSSSSSSTTTSSTTTTATSVPTTTSSTAVTTVSLYNPLGENDVRVIIGRVIRGILSLIGSLALLMFIYGGVLWLTSAGAADRVKKGKDILVWATLGLGVIFGSYAAVNAILNALTVGNVRGT